MLLSRLSVAALLTLFAVPAWSAETYSFDPSHTTVNWQANHFGFSNPSGKFPMVNGTLVLDEKTPANSRVDVMIDILKISAGDSKFEEHLKSKDFFNTEKFSTAKFTSKKVELTGKDTAKVTGDLTLLGITKPVAMDIVLNKIGENPFTKKKTAGFSGSTMLRRSDFGITYAIPGVSDEVRITIEAEANIVAN